MTSRTVKTAHWEAQEGMPAPQILYCWGFIDGSKSFILNKCDSLKGIRFGLAFFLRGFSSKVSGCLDT